MNPDQETQQPHSQNDQSPQQSDIAPKAAEQRKPLFDPTGRVEGLTAEETLIADIRRHPFGLFLIYLQVVVALGLSLVLIFAFLPSVIETLNVDSSAANSLATAFGFFAVVFGLIFFVLATRIYKGNQLIVSDKNVTQVLQIGLFNRKVSELSMANIEDVTAQQRGIFPTMFNYGVLRIETAGEQNNFSFVYCPNPNAYAKAILDARLQFISRNGPSH
jgi:hypothetical protein